jgi:hypothetical protein
MNSKFPGVGEKRLKIDINKNKRITRIKKKNKKRARI